MWRSIGKIIKGTTMRYGKIPKKVLNINLYTTYDKTNGIKDVTLQECLEPIGEDIICSEYETDIVDGKLVLLEFIAWTKHTVFTLTSDGLDKVIVAVPRHPYSFIYQK